MLFYLYRENDDECRVISGHPQVLALMLADGFKLISQEEFFTRTRSK